MFSDFWYLLSHKLALIPLRNSFVVVLFWSRKGDPPTMASAAQFEADRLNAALSCGPTSPEGKARSSRNHLKFGLFSTQNCVRTEETAEYTKLSKVQIGR